MQLHLHTMCTNESICDNRGCLQQSWWWTYLHTDPVDCGKNNGYTQLRSCSSTPHQLTMSLQPRSLLFPVHQCIHQGPGRSEQQQQQQQQKRPNNIFTLADGGLVYKTPSDSQEAAKTVTQTTGQCIPVVPRHQISHLSEQGLDIMVTGKSWMGQAEDPILQVCQLKEIKQTKEWEKYPSQFRRL